MLKQAMQQKNKSSIQFMFMVLMAFSTGIFALDSDKDAEFSLEGDNSKTLPVIKDGLTQIKFWGNVSIQQGTLKIKSDEAIVFNNSDGVSKVLLTGQPVMMEQIVDIEFGKIDIVANEIDFRVADDMLYMSGDVLIKSRIQGEMSGEKISMNLKTKEIKGEKSDNQRVKLIIKPKSK